MELAADVEHLLRQRRAEQLWLHVAPRGEHATFDEVAMTAGLAPLGRAWVEVSASQAKQMLVALLHQDMAYESELMPLRRAEWLAERFLRTFGEHGTRYATNTYDPSGADARAWTPATGWTFDSGIVVIGRSDVGLFWVADES